MPRFDLRQNPVTLNPLAPFKVLAVMCHPSNLKQRERMLALIQSETGEGQPRRHSFSNDEFVRNVKLASGNATVAGGILLTRLQLHLNGYRPSLNRAVPLVSPLLPKWEQHQDSLWSPDDHVGHRPHSRRKMLAAYKNFLSVAHLWAALIHGQQHEKLDIWPGSLETLPDFLAYADCFLELACKLPSFTHGQRFAINRSEAWSFNIPECVTRIVELAALSLNEEQQRRLNDFENRT